MKVCGIIVEYNPLHNGHLHHIKETKRISKCDVLVAVMSGNFVQRGEPAIIDKFTRTKMALENYVDLVVELPYAFCMQSADTFAMGAISILDKLEVDELYFGSESGNIVSLNKIADILDSDTYNSLLRTYLKEGNSYPTASNLSMNHFLENDDFSMPNNILGIQYIKAIRELKSNITPHTIPRINKGYYDELDQNTMIQSATAIRKEIINGNQISKYVPDSVFNHLKGRKPCVLEDFTPYLKFTLKQTSKDELQTISGVVEGLENKMIKSHDFDSIDQFIHMIISRRYTNAKLKRTIINVLCSVKNEDILEPTVDYIRILGMNEKGQLLLHSIKKEISVPIYTKISEGLHPLIDLELKTSKLYSLISDIDVFALEFKPLIFMRFNWF